MSVIPSTQAPYLKPLPDITPANREFWDALREQRFLVARCDECGEFNWVRYPACRSCLSERQTWTEVSGDATVFSYTVVHRGPGAFGADVPYLIVLGKLVEEPRACIVLANLVGVDPATVSVGMPIKIAYEEIPGEGVTMYRWVPR